jgi:hypothetical protein
MAAEQGDTRAQFNLGLMYGRGEGMADVLKTHRFNIGADAAQVRALVQPRAASIGFAFENTHAGHEGLLRSKACAVQQETCGFDNQKISIQSSGMRYSYSMR